jgi:hypothetical protein
MKTRLAFLTLLLMIAAACTIRLQAQVYWSSVGSGCAVDAASEKLALISPTYGTVSFVPNKDGDIHLSCPIPFLNSAYGQPDPGALKLTFYNNNGFDGNVNHCFLDAALLRSNLYVEQGNTISEIGTSNSNYVGRQVIAGYIPEAIDFQSSYYWVDVWLHRDSATATCNPTFVGTFLEPPPIQ